MTYIRREFDHFDELPRPFYSRRVLSKTPARILYCSHVKLACYVSRIICKSRLILSRLTRPIVGDIVRPPLGVTMRKDIVDSYKQYEQHNILNPVLISAATS